MRGSGARRDDHNVREVRNESQGGGGGGQAQRCGRLGEVVGGSRKGNTGGTRNRETGKHSVQEVDTEASITWKE